MKNIINSPIEKSNFLCGGAVVGTIHTRPCVDAALKLDDGAVDYFELRVDAFAENLADQSALFHAADSLKTPRILTVRHPKEGGSAKLSPGERRALFHQFLSLATLVDVELRSAEQLSDVVDEAKARGIGVILSHHDFKRTPPLARLHQLADEAHALGCDVFKLATVTDTPSGLRTLLEFLATANVPGSRKPSLPALAVMGMGALGKLSRLVLGSTGSVLNYGYLDKPQVPGQWPAELLKQRLNELATA